MSTSKWISFLICITLSMVLDVSAILFNGLVAYVIKKHKKTSSITFWFLYCLSISDILVGVAGLAYQLSMLLRILDFQKSSWSLIAAYAYRLQHYFIEISGQLIVIIAIDRYIHMKYLTKYSRIMTHSRARLIVLIGILFGIVVIVPIYELSERHSALYDFGTNVGRVTCTLLIYALYIKMYLRMRRQYTTLKIGKRNCIAICREPDKIRQCQSKPSSDQHYNDSLNRKVNTVFDTFKTQNTSFPCASTKGASVLQPKSNVFVLPQQSEAGLGKGICNSERQNDGGVTESVDHIVQNERTYRAADINTESPEATKSRQAIKADKRQRLQMNQKLQTRSFTPEQDFLKAIMLIFLTLFICYIPFFIYKFYSFATNPPSDMIKDIIYNFVVLNSSLNAIISIAFSKEMKRNIKAIFVER